MNEPLSILLPRLEGVQRSSKGYRARCPNCGGKSRKLAIAEVSDGTLLVKCFSCGDTPGALAAVGLGLADLFPNHPRDDTPDGRRAARETFRHAQWKAALNVLGLESKIVQIAGRYLLDGKSISPEDHERLVLACNRIDGAREVLDGR